MEEVLKNPKSNNLLLNSFIFLLGIIIAFGLYFSAFEYKYAHTDPYDSAYGSGDTSTDGAGYYCLVVDPSIGCNKTIYQAKDQVEAERFFFAAAAVLIGILISSIFIWFIFKNTKKNVLFLAGGVSGFIIGIFFILFYHFTINW